MPHESGEQMLIEESSAQHSQWLAGHAEEIAFWDEWLATHGGQWPASFSDRIDPQRPLQPFFEALLPPDLKHARILDVGAGPLTHVGFQSPQRRLEVVAVDPLAPAYDELLARHGVAPVVRTQPGDAERLTDLFAPNSFDIVTARNCIDHSYDPVAALRAMLAVCKPGSTVLLQHAIHEAETQGYAGLHQWNLLDEEGDFVLTGRSGRVNVTRTLHSRAEIRNEIQYGGIWIVTWMRKRPAGVAGALQALRPRRAAGTVVVDDPTRWLEQ
jgi:SAM-dependent methyltransferase